MPVYEYACDKCEHEFEVEQRISDAPVKTCPSCRSRKVKRLISRTSFVLKGSGWYSDLYASPKQDAAKADKGEGKGEGADAKGTADKAAASGDTKPAKKAETGKKDKAKAKGKSKAA